MQQMHDPVLQRASADVLVSVPGIN